MKRRCQILMVLLIVGTYLQRGNSDDWPQWRGAKLDSNSSEVGLPDSLDKSSQLWRTAMPGTAGSSPIVAGDNIFVTSVEGSNLVLLCVGTDGKIRWKKQLEGMNQKSRDGANSASASPSTDGEHVWAMMGNGIISCFTVDGDLVWKKDLQEEYGKFNIQFGMSTTPVLDNGNLYIALMHGNMRDSKKTSVGQVIALDAKTGKEIWMHLRKTNAVGENKHSYASPTIYRDSEREFLITHGADYVMGHSLDDGSELWRCGGFNPTGSKYNLFLRLVSSPSCSKGIIVVPTAKRGPVLALKADAMGDVSNSDDAFHWKMKQGTPDVASPVIYNGLVFLAGERGDLTCLDAGSGEVHFRERLFEDKHRSTPVCAEGKLIITGRRGTVYLVQAGTDLKVISKSDLGEEITASPAVSNGRIYVRTFDALYAFGKP